MFSEFANHAVSRLQRKGQHPEHNCDDSAQKEKSAFQGLEFLVRDFQFFSDIDDTAQCFADAESHLKKLFEFGHNQGQETHRRLEALFETITAAMLPHPGMVNAGTLPTLRAANASVQVRCETVLRLMCVQATE